MARMPMKVQSRYDRLKEMERGSSSVLLSSATYERAAEEATDGQFEFLCSLLAGEYELRVANRIARLRRQACFPFAKGFEGFSWEGIEFPADFSREELLSCGFIDRRENVVLYGGSGNGKTHTAVALGLIACGQGRRVLFKETSKLILELNAAHQEGRLKQKLDALEKCDLIILDEWGYIPCDPDGAKLLFRVISMCYEKISLLFTTNVDFSRWGAIFSDADMAGAMLDRVIHHGRLVTYDRESYRVRNSLMRADAASA
ncbi:IS21-like element helper ATPase IstB [Parafannyhessea umbonata]|uniref:IS21-like element helper ATPase IstB n=1 Tax=Parafannyhessea umbonata TaxID=604330 RepID=UPI00359C1EC0